MTMGTDTAMTELETAIREMLKRDNVSFVELSRIEGFRGRFSLVGAGRPNIIYWADMSQEAVSIMVRLLAERLFYIKPTPELTYLNAGEILPLPLVKHKRSYKTPHWLPVLLKLRDVP
jgi:hypothetical protein